MLDSGRTLLWRLVMRSNGRHRWRTLFAGRAPATRSQDVTRLVLGAVMTFAGASHLTTARDEF